MLQKMVFSSYAFIFKFRSRRLSWPASDYQASLAVRHAGAGVAGNLVLRGYLKHFNFFLSNIELLFDRSFDLAQVILPIGISFFTFQQIAYLVDVHRQGDLHYGLGDYSLFVSFFTQLITGPIVHRKETAPAANLAVAEFQGRQYCYWDQVLRVGVVQ